MAACSSCGPHEIRHAPVEPIGAVPMPTGVICKSLSPGGRSCRGMHEPPPHEGERHVQVVYIVEGCKALHIRTGKRSSPRPPDLGGVMNGFAGRVSARRALSSEPRALARRPVGAP